MIKRKTLVLLLLLGAACSPQPTPSATPTMPPQPTELPLAQFAESAAGDAFCPPPPNWYVYRTEAGDTLQDLAGRTNSSVSELATANCLQNPRALISGQTLYLPRRLITP